MDKFELTITDQEILELISNYKEDKGEIFGFLSMNYRNKSSLC